MGKTLDKTTKTITEKTFDTLRRFEPKVKSKLEALAAGLAKHGPRLQRQTALWVEKKRGRFHNLEHRINESSHQLSDCCTSSEPNFLQLGATLQDIYKETRSLTAQARNTVSMISGEKGNDLSGVGELAKTSFAGLQRTSESVETTLGDAKAIAVILAKLITVCPKIDKLSLYLRTVGLNMGIESTRSRESGDMFSTASEEIIRVAEHIREISGHISADSEHACQQQQSSQDSIYKKLSELKTVGDEGARDVNQAVAEIEALLSQSLQTLEDTRKRSETISAEIGEIVVGIQLHDSMRQRLEHVIESIEEVGDNLAALDLPRFSDKQKTAKLYHLLTIQSAQISTISEEIREAYQTTTSSFQSIGDEVASIASRLRAVIEKDEQKDESKTSGNAFTILTASLRNLSMCLKQGISMQDEIHTAVDRTLDSLQTLSRYAGDVREINLETHLNALNTIVMASHLGNKGKTLEVLAQEMNRLSGESDACVTSVNDSLEEMRAAASEMRSKAFEEKETQEHNRLEEAIASLEQVYRTFLKESSCAYEKASELRAAICNVNDSLTFLNELSNTLDQINKLFAAAAAAVEPWSQAESAEGKDESVNRYTMEKERSIHQQILGTNTAQTTSIEPETSDIMLFTDEEEKPSDNESIELFHEDETDNGIELFGSEPESADSDGDIELFKDAPEESEAITLFDDEPVADDPTEVSAEAPPDEETKKHTKKQSQPAEDNDDFGDNIELF